MLTVATVWLDDVQLARLVTFCVVPVESVAVAANCADPPTLGADPVTETDVTVGAGGVVVAVDGPAGTVVPPPHAHQPSDKMIADKTPPLMRRICTLARIFDCLGTSGKYKRRHSGGSRILRGFQVGQVLGRSLLIEDQTSLIPEPMQQAALNAIRVLDSRKT
jgi:hypothetical protein